jgi:phosphoserine phosphatase
MLIARLIAEKTSLESGLDACLQNLDGASLVHGAAHREGGVVQISAPNGSATELRSAIEQHLGPSALLITDHEPALPKLFVSDMDSTMIGQECIDELADYAGLKDKVAAITEAAMRGELEFAEALLERVALLKGLDESAIAECLAERIRPEPGARTLVQTLKAKGARTVLVTGGFHHFADRVAQQLGFDRVVGNRLAVHKGKLTGKLDGPISDAATKLATLREEAAELGGNARVLASGDGANDIPMLEAADYGFAYHAKPVARVAANGVLDHGGLTSVLQLLAIDESDWVTD